MVQISWAARLFVFFIILVGLYMATPNFFARTQDVVDEQGIVTGQDCFVPAPFLCRQINLGLDSQGGAFASFEIDEEAYWRSVFKDEQLGIEALGQGQGADPKFYDLLLSKMDLISADDGGWVATFDILSNASGRDIALAYRR